MRPGSSAAISRRATSQDSTNGPRRLVPNTVSMSSMDILWARWASGTPALLTRIVTVPSARSACSTTSRMLSVSVMSRRMPTARPPAASISATTSSSRSGRRPLTATAAPAAASTRAKRRPRPEVAPVTRATWPSRSVERFGRGKSATLRSRKHHEQRPASLTRSGGRVNAPRRPHRPPTPRRDRGNRPRPQPNDVALRADGPVVAAPSARSAPDRLGSGS